MTSYRRPGYSVPLQYADTTTVENLESVAVDFFDKILGYNITNDLSRRKQLIGFWAGQ